ncbi:hypothetical protein [Acaryochloris sp. IP29b_bin.137]|uniref:hypothetical protein n=1 Tax=Acaryochloris sp. IP29b_bin.137 TaxID=2969217 RepID=UPI0026393C54|nr:hypothetical protein [Acaryochloris sp. IP29b_bin.137]
MKALLTAGLIALTPTIALAQFGLPVDVPEAPDKTQFKPKGLPIPKAQDLSQASPRVTTDFTKAYPEVALFDDWQPQQIQALADLPQDTNGNYQLKPGLYEQTFESYSLQVGAYAPGKRNGYHSAPLLEDQQALISSLLQTAAQVKDITQSQIQSLIWAILSRAEFKKLSPELQTAAKQLLQPKVIQQLNQQALGLIPTEKRSEVFASLPQKMHNQLEAEASMRAALSDQKKYSDLERIAIQSGHPKSSVLKTKTPQGQWSYHPNGFFIRSIPSGYRRTLVQLAVPERYKVKRDPLGRIIEISDPAGNRIETDYDDTTQPLAIPEDPNLVGYAFEEIRFIRSPAKTTPPETVTLANIGWTLMHNPQASSRSRPLNAIPTRIASRVASQLQLAETIDDSSPATVFAAWEKRAQQAEDHQQRIDRYIKRWQTTSSKPSRKKIQQLADLYHYADAIADATDDKGWASYKWLKGHQAAIFQALQYETALLERGSQPPTLTFNPTSTVTLSPEQQRQILGLANRPYQP